MSNTRRSRTRALLSEVNYAKRTERIQGMVQSPAKGMARSRKRAIICRVVTWPTHSRAAFKRPLWSLAKGNVPQLHLHILVHLQTWSYADSRHLKAQRHRYEDINVHSFGSLPSWCQLLFTGCSLLAQPWPIAAFIVLPNYIANGSSNRPSLPSVCRNSVCRERLPAKGVATQVLRTQCPPLH